jgi:tetratricopeptide (TPR) repeat protein
MTSPINSPRCIPTWVLAGALFGITLIVYIPAYTAGFIWDDDHYVTQNPVLRDAEGLRRIWFEIGATPQYYPLVHSSFWLEHHFYNLKPFGYHFINVLLHAGSAVLLFVILRRLRVPGAWFGAALFAIHPVQVESVAWVTERKNVLSGMFYLSAMLCYLVFDARRSGDTVESQERQDGRAWYVLAVFSFVCALLSKTVTSTLPAAILLAIYWLRGRIDRRDWLRTAPMFVLGLGFAGLTAWMERKEVGAEGSDWSFSIIERFLIAGRVCWFYLGKLLWPHPLIFIYPRWVISDHVWWQYLFPLAAIALLAVLWRMRDRWGRGPLVAMLFFGGSLFPALGFFNVYPMRFSFVADHFQYLASIGPLTLIGAGLFIGGRRLARGQSARMGQVLPMAALLIAGVLSWRQVFIYQNIEGLWRDTLARNPTAWMAHGNLAAGLAEQGRLDEALEHAAVVLRARPDLPSTHVNHGDILIRARRGEEAEAAYRRALEIDANHLKAHFALGNLLVDMGRTKEAIEQLSRVVELAPEFPSGHRRLGIAYEDAGDWANAAAEYRRALELQPRFPDAMHGLARIYMKTNHNAEAVACFQKAIAMRPNFPEAYNDLATIFAAIPDDARAIKCLQEAVRLKPDYSLARLNLATLLADAGRTAEAEAQLRIILRDHPEDADAKKALSGLRQPASGPAEPAKP